MAAAASLVGSQALQKRFPPLQCELDPFFMRSILTDIVQPLWDPANGQWVASNEKLKAETEIDMQYIDMQYKGRPFYYTTKVSLQKLIQIEAPNGKSVPVHDPESSDYPDNIGIAFPNYISFSLNEENRRIKLLHPNPSGGYTEYRVAGIFNRCKDDIIRDCDMFGYNKYGFTQIGKVIFDPKDIHAKEIALGREKAEQLSASRCCIIL